MHCALLQPIRNTRQEREQASGILKAVWPIRAELSLFLDAKHRLLKKACWDPEGKFQMCVATKPVENSFVMTGFQYPRCLTPSDLEKWINGMRIGGKGCLGPFVQDKP